jgi:hypothetical protein
MNIQINPEMWNSLSRVQKRAVAETIRVEKRPLFKDMGELSAWMSTLAATAAVVAFATLLLK